jgi:phage shock protein PspC (stress-responsive transcriptional regulator)
MSTVRRSSNDRKIAGVCAGLAKAWGADPLWVRVGAGVLVVTGAATAPVLVAYLILWWLLPEE